MPANLLAIARFYLFQLFSPCLSSSLSFSCKTIQLYCSQHYIHDFIYVYVYLVV